MNSNKDLNKRSLFFGLNSAFVAILVITIIALINFVGTQYPGKFDLTKNKIHTFSDESAQVMKGLKEDLHATFFGDAGSREKYRPVLDNYKKLSSHFKLEIVDPNKEPTRAKTSNITKMNTLLLAYGDRTSKVEDITEEKVTNEIIKITKNGKSIVCTVVGHGEQSFSDNAPNAFAAAKKGLEDQSYEVKEVVLPQLSIIPAECSALIMMGSSKALFPSEVKLLSAYLANGGRLLVGVDAAITAADQTKELKDILHQWGIDVKPGLIIDPFSKSMGADASVPIIDTFNKDHAIAKDSTQRCFFPFARPIDMSTPAIPELKTVWIAKTSPKAWGEMNMASIAKGEVQYNEGVDLAGPVTVAVASSGKMKDSKATRETRIVVFGTSQFANTQFSRFGGNLDLFLNSASWVLEDESMISIRPKEEQASQVELSQNQGFAIFWICVIFFPLFLTILGIVIWVKRKKL